LNKENKDKVKSNVCLIKDCSRPTHKESKYCIFHASEKEKTEEEFKNALKEYVNMIKEEGKDYDFKSFIFVGNIDFRKDLGITVFKNADLREATFRKDVDFTWATFSGYAHFKKVTFEEDADFLEATFRENADFGEATFRKDVEFEKATFRGNANFREATFRGYTHFEKATFRGYANFREATFEEDANFKGATFEENADFEKATFREDADFLVKYFAKDVNFAKAILFPGKKLNLIVEKEGTISFERTYLENVYLELYLSVENLIDFTDALLKNTQIKKDQIENHILQEKKKEFSQAHKIYLRLKNNFHSIGQYNDESWAFKKEKYMERLSYSFFPYRKDLEEKEKKERFPILKWMCTKDFKKWIISAFSNLIYGYGEEPRNVVTIGLVIIFIFALLFSFIGIGSPEFIELKGPIIQEVPGNDIEIIFKGFLQNRIIKHFFKSLYFSLITFTTLGYGDLRPLEGCGRMFAGIEAFIGAIMMALFVYTFARRTGGR